MVEIFNIAVPIFNIDISGPYLPFSPESAGIWWVLVSQNCSLERIDSHSPERVTVTPVLWASNSNCEVDSFTIDVLTEFQASRETRVT